MRYVLVVAMLLTGVALGQELPADPNEIKTLTVTQADTLVQRKCRLSLNGLTTLSDEVAKSLAQNADALLLGGLTTLSREAAVELARHKSNLVLSGLATISNEVATSLARHEGALFLNGLTEVSDETVAALAEHRGWLSLDGLTTLSVKAAAELAKHDGNLDLNGLTALTNEAAQALSRHRGRLSLYGLTALSDEAAKTLAMEKETVGLPPALAEKFSHAREAVVAEQRKKVASPAWVDYEDLGAILDSFSDDRGAALAGFVRYGTPELAKKATEGDRFDREEAREAAAEHRKGLIARRFYLQRSYQWDERESSGDMKDAVRLRVGLDFRCTAPGHDANVGIAAYREAALWFMTKDEKLQECVNMQQARVVQEANGIFYVPEVLDRCELVLCVDGPRDVQKSVAREPGQHIVNVGLTGLRVERPLTYGFYKLDAVRFDGYTSGSILNSFFNGNNNLSGTPNYFVTRELKPGDDSSMPEVVTADLAKVEVVNIAGNERKVVFSWSKR